MGLFAIAAFVSLIGAAPVSPVHQTEQMLTCRGDNASEDYSELDYPPLKALFRQKYSTNVSGDVAFVATPKHSIQVLGARLVRVNVASGQHIGDNQSFAILAGDFASIVATATAQRHRKPRRISAIEVSFDTHDEAARYKFRIRSLTGHTVRIRCQWYPTG